MESLEIELRMIVKDMGDLASLASGKLEFLSDEHQRRIKEYLIQYEDIIQEGIDRYKTSTRRERQLVLAFSKCNIHLTFLNTNYASKAEQTFRDRYSVKPIHLHDFSYLATILNYAIQLEGIYGLLKNNIPVVEPIEVNHEPEIEMDMYLEYDPNSLKNGLLHLIIQSEDSVLLAQAVSRFEDLILDYGAVPLPSVVKPIEGTYCKSLWLSDRSDPILEQKLIDMGFAEPVICLYSSTLTSDT